MTERSAAECVTAVVVAFSPDPTRFEKVLAAAKGQCASVIVVDNADGSGLGAVEWSDRVWRLDMHKNAGVAAAQNAGLEAAFASGATHALLLDHDSVAGDDMVQRLHAAWLRLETQGEKVATAGANYRDPRRPDVSPFVRIEGWRLRRPRPHEPVPWVSYVISSGSLISRAAFETVGPMDDRLFVDYVDIEWGLRASQMGWRSFGVAEAMLDHLLGDAQLRIMGTSYPTRSPLRHYYMVRNATWLILKGSLPLDWKVVEGARLIRRSVAYALFAPRRHLHAMSMLAGLRDGIRGRLGERTDAA